MKWLHLVTSPWNPVICAFVSHYYWWGQCGAGMRYLATGFEEPHHALTAATLQELQPDKLRQGGLSVSIVPNTVSIRDPLASPFHFASLPTHSCPGRQAGFFQSASSSFTPSPGSGNVPSVKRAVLIQSSLKWHSKQARAMTIDTWSWLEKLYQRNSAGLHAPQLQHVRAYPKPMISNLQFHWEVLHSSIL